MISREQLKKDVVDQLYWDDRVDAAEIQVEVEEGGFIRLSGSVPSYTAYRAAEADALAVRGTCLVHNDLEVRYPPQVVREDEEITASIQGGLTWYPDIDGNKIEVIVNAGEVTLRGAVDSFWKKIKAEELAYDTAGVTWVVNELAVVPTRKLADEAIAGEIEAALDRNSDILDPDAIELTVKDGAVQLGGTVPDYRSFIAAESMARYTPGVVDVENKLRVVRS